MWFYPFCPKSDFFDLYKLFESMIDKQFQDKIKVVQTDGEEEFVSNKLKNYLANYSNFLAHILLTSLDWLKEKII